VRVRDRWKLAIGIGTAAAIVVFGATPAAAKGPTGVTITDPAGQSTELPAVPAGADGAAGAAGAEGAADDRLMRLADDMGFWEAIDPQVELPQAAPGRPGPAFPVAWTLFGPDGDVEVAQTLYPQAEGGPLVHTAPGQEAYGLALPGGWYRASSRLMDTLAALGWGTKLTAVEPSSDADSTARRGPTVISGGIAVGIAVGVALGAGLGGTAALRRRREASVAGG
jgi:hypothetical protein